MKFKDFPPCPIAGKVCYKATVGCDCPACTFQRDRQKGYQEKYRNNRVPRGRPVVKPVPHYWLKIGIVSDLPPDKRP